MKINSKKNVLSGRKQRNGFTLVELLVVISIIAMLLAILMPSLSKARQIAKRMICKSNLKQLAMGWHMFLEDNDQYFYQGVNANLTYGGWRGIKGEPPRPGWPADRPLNPYFDLPTDLESESGTEVFRCPSDKGGYRPTLVREKVHKAVGTSYQTNIFLIGQNSCGSFSSWTSELDKKISDRLDDMKFSRACNPSRLFLIGDYGWINQWKPRNDPKPEWKALAEWHDKEDWHNLAFLDGHVEFLEIKKGIYVSDNYSILPFKDLYSLAHEVQGPEN